jgi:integrase/recombinase XerD
LPGRQRGIDLFPRHFRHHFSSTWLDRGGTEDDLMEHERQRLRSG